ncbi:hypothetical protein OG923_33075 (plasmid) [Streptomyces halstedii]|uniref:hypothetical protein n=1 Tax=Streptomyces halstedii TaxID=1944 RepID=UPI002F90DF8E
MNSPVSAPDLLRGVQQALEADGLRHGSDVEAWVDSDDEVLCKVTVAPGDRRGAAAVPGRVLRALHAAGYTPAAASESGAPDSWSVEAALGAGHAVRVVHG